MKTEPETLSQHPVRKRTETPNKTISASEGQWCKSLGGTKSQRRCIRRPQHLKGKGVPKQNQTKALLFTSLTAYCWAKLAHNQPLTKNHHSYITITCT